MRATTRCLACGRVKNKNHDNKIRNKKPYDPNCTLYESVPKAKARRKKGLKINVG